MDEEVVPGCGYVSVTSRRCRASSVLPPRPDSTATDTQIKYFRIADAVLDQAAEEQERQRTLGRQRGSHRGEYGCCGY